MGLRLATVSVLVETVLVLKHASLWNLYLKS